MPYLGRKVKLGTWSVKPEFGELEVPADTVTADLRTTGNTLSFWEWESPAAAVCERTALAMAAAKGANRIDQIDIAWLDRARLDDEGIVLLRTEGNTHVPDLRSYHIDAARLDAVKLAIVARQLAEAIRKHNQCQRFSKRQVLEMLSHAVRDQRLQLNVLDPQVRDELGQ